MVRVSESLKPALPTQPHLWHLVPASELYKLDTFLRGGLWCAGLGTIVTFEGDTESTLPYGLFVSCWHMNTTPSLKAWEILGGKGHGLALRTSTEAMQALIQSTSIDEWKISFGVVNYKDVSTAGVPSPFTVAHSHTHENEARLVISAQEEAILNNSIVDHRDSFARYLSRDEADKYESISIVGQGRADAIILPINPALFIQEILVGWLVTNAEKIHLTHRLDKHGLADKLRVAPTLI
jgi:hypothetical protein